MTDLNEEFIALLGEIRDQLKRIADLLDAITKGEANLNVETGLLQVRVKGKVDTVNVGSNY